MAPRGRGAVGSGEGGVADGEGGAGRLPVPAFRGRSPPSGDRRHVDGDGVILSGRGRVRGLQPRFVDQNTGRAPLTLTTDDLKLRQNW